MNKTYENYQSVLVSALTDKYGVNADDVIPVWFSKVVENAKGLFIINGSDSYYEVTYHGKRNIFYIDEYSKISHCEHEE